MRHCASSHRSGFSLAELLAVLAITSILMGGLLPSISALMSAGNLGGSASDISTLLVQARTYAMAKNTYVYLGVQEVDALRPSTADGTGRVVVEVVTSRDGTRPYTNGSLSTDNLISISKPEIFNNVHLASAAALHNGSNMASRPAVSVDLSQAIATTSFSWPLAGTPQYNFSKVIEFDPQGVARVQTGGSYNPTVQACIEIPLVPAHGDVAATDVSNQAAVQVDGVTGAACVYRP